MTMAIAHEWISARAGSEKVFEELAGAFPEAELYALTHTPGVSIETSGRPVRTTFLDRSNALRDRRGLTLPLMPLAWRVSGRGMSYDTVITSSHACVKGFRPARTARHLCYVHAPMRYVWNPEIDNRAGSFLAAPPRAMMRRWDRRSARWVDSFAANSSAVAARVEAVYGRPARVIAPPVDTTFFSAAPQVPREGLVTLGRLIPYKGHDVAIEVAARLDVPLTIVGSGPEEQRLRVLAQSRRADVTFMVGASDDAVRIAIASAAALLFPANEDFGIVPVEAQAAGTPVVGPAMGGLLDTVVADETGVLAADLSLESMVAATRQVLDSDLDPERCRLNAARFSAARFRREVRDWLASES